MTCRESRLLIAGLAGDDIPERLAAHVANCPACAERLAWDARLRATLRSASPVPSPAVLDRIRAEIAATETLPLGGGQGGGVPGLLGRNPLVRAALPVAALLAAVFMATLPHEARAATPVETFARMRAAILRAAPKATRLAVRSRMDKGIASRSELSDRLAELEPEGDLRADHKAAAAKPMVQERALSNSAPAARPQTQATAEAQQERRRADYDLSPAPMDVATSKAMFQEHDIDFSVGLAAADYRSIAFGADRDHLVLTPKKPKDRRYVVTLDPKSGLPKNVLVQRADHGRWIALRDSPVKWR